MIPPAPSRRGPGRDDGRPAWMGAGQRYGRRLHDALRLRPFHLPIRAGPPRAHCLGRNGRGQTGSPHKAVLLGLGHCLRARGARFMRPRVRAATLTGYKALAASLGLEPDRLVANEGLSPADLDVPDRCMPAGPVARLLELSAQRSGCHDFGLRLAEVRRLGTLGPLSLVLREEPTLRAALDLLIRHERVYNEALHMRMRDDGDLTTVALWLEFGEPAPTAQASDLVMGALLGIIRALVGAAWMPRYVSFAHGPPEDATAYHRLCGPDVRFAARHTALTFPKHQSDTPVLASDASLRPY